MNKILIISQHFPPEIGAASNRLNQMVQQFKQNKLDVYVITMKPNYPNPRLYTKHMMEEVDSNINIHLYRSPIIRGNFSDKFLRLMNQILFILYAILVSTIITLKHSIKICITTSPPFLVNFVGLYCKLILRRKWILEVRDLWPDSLVAVNAVKKTSKLFKILKKWEMLFYKKSNQIVVVTNRTRTILISQGIDENKIHVITNGIPQWILKGSTGSNNQNDTFNVCYIGNLGLSQNLGILIDVANELKQDSKIKFYIIGEGLAKEALVSKTKQKHLNNVIFVPGITDKNELLKWYYQANLGIVSLNKTPLFENVIPSKIFEYAASGTYMLFLGKGEAAEIIEEYELGISIDPEVKKVANIIQKFADQTNNLYTNSDKKTVFLNKYSWENLIKKYIEIIDIEVQ
jgi:glycosyltransferase involved in cell wall biosynthesis